MPEQNETRNRGGRPPKIGQKERGELQRAHKVWVLEQARKYSVAVWTIYRSLQYRKKPEIESDLSATTEKAA